MQQSNTSENITVMVNETTKNAMSTIAIETFNTQIMKDINTYESLRAAEQIIKNTDIREALRTALEHVIAMTEEEVRSEILRTTLLRHSTTSDSLGRSTP